MDDYKREFMKIKNLDEFEDFKKEYPNFKDDEDMRKHFVHLLEKQNMLKTSENHSDPRRASNKR